jgi:pimeloyl-ACP methyl ester carboxylesterase
MGLGQEAWHYQRRDLEVDHRVVTFDLRGHGGSDPAVDDDYSAGALADDVVAVLQQAAPDTDRAVLVGHSLGGMSVLAALRHHPEVMRSRAAGIGLVATAGADVVGGVVRTGAAVAATVVQSALVRSRPARFVRRRLEEPRRDNPTDLSLVITRLFGLSRSAPPGVIEFVDRLNRRVPAGVLGALAATLTTIDELDYLEGVDVPVAVVVGEEDRLTPPSQAEKIVARVPAADFVCVPQAGHTVMVEQPEPVTAALRRLSIRCQNGR